MIGGALFIGLVPFHEMRNLEAASKTNLCQHPQPRRIAADTTPTILCHWSYSHDDLEPDRVVAMTGS